MVLIQLHVVSSTGERQPSWIISDNHDFKSQAISFKVPKI